MKTILIMPVKKNSSRLKNKNILPIFDKPMFIFTLFEAMKCKFINKFYAYEDSSVLFKPTLASKNQFRTDKIAALSYFIGGNSNFGEDNGFAIKGWHQIRWENVGINIIDDIALCMGNYFFSLKGEEDLKVEFSLVVRKVNGNLKIILHDSHLPYQQQ